MDVDAHRATVDDDLGGAVLVRAREDAVGVRRRAELVDLLLEELDLLLGFLERVDELLVLALGVGELLRAAAGSGGAARRTRRARGRAGGGTPSSRCRRSAARPGDPRPDRPAARADRARAPSPGRGPDAEMRRITSRTKPFLPELPASSNSLIAPLLRRAVSPEFEEPTPMHELQGSCLSRTHHHCERCREHERDACPALAVAFAPPLAIGRARPAAKRRKTRGSQPLRGDRRASVPHPDPRSKRARLHLRSRRECPMARARSRQRLPRRIRHRNQDRNERFDAAFDRQKPLIFRQFLAFRSISEHPTVSSEPRGIFPSILAFLHLTE